MTDHREMAREWIAANTKWWGAKDEAAGADSLAALLDRVAAQEREAVRADAVRRIREWERRQMSLVRPVDNVAAEISALIEFGPRIDAAIRARDGRPDTKQGLAC